MNFPLGDSFPRGKTKICSIGLNRDKFQFYITFPILVLNMSIEWELLLLLVLIVLWLRSRYCCSLTEDKWVTFGFSSLFHITKLFSKVILTLLEKEFLSLSFCQQLLATQDIIFPFSHVCFVSLTFARSRPEPLPPFIRPKQVSPEISAEALRCYKELSSGLQFLWEIVQFSCRRTEGKCDLFTPPAQCCTLKIYSS